jgi:RNA polymerase subunit RPABC4/transcription elongation factor Spt4
VRGIYVATTTDTTKPVIWITSPRLNENTGRSPITVTGIVSDDVTKAEKITVEVDAPGLTEPKQATVNAVGEFTITVPLLKGSNIIAVTAVDDAGNERKTSLGIEFVDINRPTLVITSPATGTKTDKPNIIVSGMVSDDVTAAEELTIKVDAPSLATPTRVRAGPDGGFNTSIPLLEGPNLITVTVSDGAGNSAFASVEVEHEVVALRTYVIFLLIAVLTLVAIAIFRKPSKMKVARCANCGRQIPRTAKFCPACGERVKEEPKMVEKQIEKVRASRMRAPVLAPRTTFCWNCGEKLPSSTRVCPACGVERRGEQ